MAVANTVHIAGRGSVVRQLQILVSQFHVLRTGTLFEIRPDNMYQPLCFMLRETVQQMPTHIWHICKLQNTSRCFSLQKS